MASSQVRLQAQLGKRKNGNVMYKGTVDCFVKTYRAEGIRGLQAGLGPSVFKEGTKVYMVCSNAATAPVRVFLEQLTL